MRYAVPEIGAAANKWTGPTETHMSPCFGDRARTVMRLANQEAQRFNHEYIGTEHILLGLVKEGAGVAANVLKNLDIDLGKIRLEVEKIVQLGPDTVAEGVLPQTPRAKKVIEYSIEEVRNLNRNFVGTEHLLLGLLREEEGVAAQILNTQFGLRLEDFSGRSQWEGKRQLLDPTWQRWNDGTIPKTARVIAAERRWGELPILADALEDAGCTDAEILGHLRQPEDRSCRRWHANTVWLLNVLLGTDEGGGVSA
jgi:hypothetical protein